MSDDTLSVSDETRATPLAWGENAPVAVLQRIYKEGAKVPLFLGQTLVNTMRDVGYNDTTSAVCEHVDNALQWGAKNVHIYFNERKRDKTAAVDVMILDDGQGMSPNTLQFATAFGGSTVSENRQGIGRFGVGMKAAALSMSPVLEIFSWQEARAFYQMTLDVYEISQDKRNLIELPEPTFSDSLPLEVTRILTTPLAFPKNPNETQRLVADSIGDLYEKLGEHGTIIFMPDCDRLTYKTAKSLVDHAIKGISRVYRRYLERGVKIYINNRPVEAFDPTFWQVSARHTKILTDLNIKERRSSLVHTWERIEIPIQEGSPLTAPVSVRLYRLPIEEWNSSISKRVLTNELQVYSSSIVSFMRADREVFAGTPIQLIGKQHGNNYWLRLQIDFPAELDEAMGVAMNKQGVRPKSYVYEAISQKIGEQVSATRQSIAQAAPERLKKSASGQMNEAERRANAADGLQPKSLPAPAPATEEEKQVLEGNLRTLAMTMKRPGESETTAFERIEHSTYVTHFVHDEFWPFYNVDYRFGKVILTINSAHPFYEKLYKPLVELGTRASSDSENEDGDAAACNSELVVMLQLVLLSLARTQSQLTSGGDEERVEAFKMLQKEWSEAMRVQMSAI